MPIGTSLRPQWSRSACVSMKARAFCRWARQVWRRRCNMQGTALRSRRSTASSWRAETACSTSRPLSISWSRSDCSSLAIGMALCPPKAPLPYCCGVRPTAKPACRSPAVGRVPNPACGTEKHPTGPQAFRRPCAPPVYKQASIRINWHFVPATRTANPICPERAVTRLSGSWRADQGWSTSRSPTSSVKSVRRLVLPPWRT
ncbi:hypothetical protein RSUY_33540 (plasmid) [Ralstonia solanacearum]|nr:hypothetical protein RSUY_33540 [Ralstonia solanacearum]